MNLIKLQYAPGAGTGEPQINPEAVSSVVPSPTGTVVTMFCGTQFYIPLSIDSTAKLLTGQVADFAAAQKLDLAATADTTKATDTVNASGALSAVAAPIPQSTEGAIQ